MMPNIVDAAAFLIECQQVIWLRTMKLAAGGAKAQVEANLMVAEKLFAAADAGLGLSLGRKPERIFRKYRRTVRSNRRRLSKKA